MGKTKCSNARLVQKRNRTKCQVNGTEEVGFPISNIGKIMTKSLTKKRVQKEKPKIFERNPNTGVIRWRYVGESPDKYGWPNYGRILNVKSTN